jgi:restriction endonuclease S subunit
MGWQNIVKEKKLQVASVKLSELNVETRLDAEYYRPEALFYLKNLENKKAVQLSSLAKFVVGPFGSTVTVDKYVDETDYSYIRNQDISDFVVKKSDAHISKDLFERLKQFHVKENDLLVTVVGTLGKVAIARNADTKSIFSCKSTIIRCTDIDPYYLATFLNSKVGQTLLLRCKRGAIQEGLNLFDIKTIETAIAPKELQELVREKLKSSLLLSDKADIGYKEAEEFFLKEINLEGYKGGNQNISVRNLKDCLIDDRFDAEYWQPKYDELIKRVSSVPQKDLGEIVSVKKGVETGSEAYSEEGKLFVRVSDFSIYGIDEGEKRIAEELYKKLKDDYRPHKGEVLFTKDGTIGISFALHEDIDAIVSGAFLRLKPKIKINTDYLALALNSSYCKSQIERMSGGAIIAHLKPDSAMKIKIPMLSDEKQEEIAEKVSEALRLRKEAKALLEKSKRAVEIFVEQDEKEALNYLKQ